MVFKLTAPVQPITEEEQKSNSGVIVAIIIIVLLIVLVMVDVCLFFAKNIGLTAFIVSKLGIRRSEKDKEAMIEEGIKQR